MSRMFIRLAALVGRRTYRLECVAYGPGWLDDPDLFPTPGYGVRCAAAYLGIQLLDALRRRLVDVALYYERREDRSWAWRRVEDYRLVGVTLSRNDDIPF